MMLIVAAAISLAWPVDCRLGESCAIQSYPDADAGPGTRDHACRQRTYDGHDGTDIRLPSMAAQRTGVKVLAAAAGTVLRVRDGVDDVSVRQRAFVAGQDCGNGLVIDHGGGWQTQYCHMAKGSLAVRLGDRVAAGRALGTVGLSGNTEFPHLHLTVRQDGRTIDPFAAGRPAGACSGGADLWARPIGYRAGEVLAAGFAAAPVTMAEAQESGARQMPPGRATSLVAFVQAIGLEGGDVQRLTLTGPDGRVLADNRMPPLDRAKAQTIVFAGRKPPAGGWAAGLYRARYTVLRGGRAVVERSFETRQ